MTLNEKEYSMNDLMQEVKGKLFMETLDSEISKGDLSRFLGREHSIFSGVNTQDNEYSAGTRIELSKLKSTFILGSKIKLINSLLSDVNGMDYIDLFTKIDIHVPREFTTCLDVIVYKLQPAVDNETLNGKHLREANQLLSPINLPYNKFLILKYKLLCGCLANLQEDSNLLHIYYRIFSYLSVIELIKYNLSGKGVISLTESGKTKTTVRTLCVFQPLNLLLDYRWVEDAFSYWGVNNLNVKVTVCAQHAKETIVSFVRKVTNYIVAAAIHDCETILLNTINNLENQLVFAPISKYSWSCYARSITPSTEYTKRKFITSGKGNTLIPKDTLETMKKFRLNYGEGNTIQLDLSDISMILVKEYLLWDEFPVICASIAYVNGYSYSVMIPLSIDKQVQFEGGEENVLLTSFLEVDDVLVPVKDAYDVVSPYYWKYKDRPRSKLPTVQEMKTIFGKQFSEKTIEIYMHKAKLGNPSPEAQELAKKLCIKLEPGETLVRTHTRHYGKK